MTPRQTIIITGGNTGLGFEAARAIARDRTQVVVIASRNPELGQHAMEALTAEGGHAVFLPLDLGSQASVRRFKGLFHEAQLPPLFGIICNAGMQNVGAPQKTLEGYETTFAVNHLSHYLLVRLLLDDLAPDGRITFVASGTHDPNERTGMPHPVYRDAESVAHDFEAGQVPGLRRYTTSKLCNVLCTYALSRELAASHDARLRTIKVNGIDPGLMPATGLARSFPKPLQWVAKNVLPLVRLINENVHSPQTSGERLAALTMGPEAAPGGRYFSNGKAIRSSDVSYDQALQRELWHASARMTGLPIALQAAN